MRRRAFLGVCSASLIGLLRTSALTWANDETVKIALTDSIIPGVPSKLVEVAARPFKTLVESAMGMRGRIVTGGTAGCLAKKLKEDKVQVGVFQGIEFAWARETNPNLEPIVICVNQQRKLKAHLLVRADAPFKATAELRGKTLTESRDTYEHCKSFLRCKCVPESCKVKTFFKKVLNAADVEESLDDVLDRKADAALIDGLAWESYQSSKPGCARKLRVLRSSEAFPCAIIACQKGRFSADHVRRFRRALIRARNEPRGRQLLEFLRLSGFETVPNDYGQLFTSIVKAYPAPH